MPKLLNKRICYGDYNNYPQELLRAAMFRDLYKDQPRPVYNELAREEGVFDELSQLHEWEMANTHPDTVKRA